MMETIPHTISNYIFPLNCGFGIGFGIGFGSSYGIGRKYPPIWVSVSVSDLNQNCGIEAKYVQSKNPCITGAPPDFQTFHQLCDLMPGQCRRKWGGKGDKHLNPQILATMEAKPSPSHDFLLLGAPQNF